MAFKDFTGNIDSTYDSTIYDTQKPTGISIVVTDINGNTSNATPAMTLGATGADSMRFRVNAGAWGGWLAYAGSKNDLDISAGGDGLKRIWVAYKDYAGNTDSTYDSTVYDTQAPTGGSIVITGNQGYTKDNQPDLTLAATGADSMRFQVNVEGWGAWTAYATIKTDLDISGAGDGLKKIYVEYKDNAGNTATAVHDSTILDRIAPAPVSLALAGSGGYTNNATPAISVNATSADSMSYELDAGGWSAYEAYSAAKSGFSISAGGDGLKRVYAKFRDLAGNESNGALYDSTNYDTTPPSGITVSVADSTNNSTPPVALTAAGADSMRFQINAGGWTVWEAFAALKSDLDISVGGDGSKEISVELKDLAGNSASVKDTTYYNATGPAPLTILIADNAGFTNDSQPDISVSALNADSMAFKVNGGAWTAYRPYGILVSDVDITSGGNGHKTAYVRFKDILGNVTNGLMHDTTNYDTQAPAGTLIAVSDNQGFTKIATPVLTLAATGADSMAFKLNGGTWTAYKAYATSESSFDVSAGGQGLKHVFVKFRDLAGNETNGTLSDSTAYDTQAPVVAVNALSTTDSTPMLSGTVNDSTASISVTVAGQTKAAVNNANGTWMLADNLLSPIAVGTYNIAVSATDLAGNIGNDTTANELTVIPTVIIDTTVPSNVTALRAVALLRDSIAVNWTRGLSADAESLIVVYRANGFAPRYDSGTVWAKLPASATGDTLTGLNDSTWYFVSVFVKDTAGNWSAADTAAEDSAFTPDTTTHLINMRPVLSGWSGDSAISFVCAHDGSGKITFRYILKDSNDVTAAVRLEYSTGSSWIPTANVSGDTGNVAVNDTIKRSITWAAKADLGVTDTLYSVRLIADDGHLANNRDTLASSAFLVDTKAPQGQSVAILDSNGYANSLQPQLAILATGADSMALASSLSGLSGASFVAYSATATAPAFANEGLNRVYVWFKDSLGNLDTTALHDSTVVDTTSPVLFIGNPVAGVHWMTGGSRSLSWKATDANLALKTAKLDYQEGSGVWNVIADSLTDSGVYSWTVPQTPDSNVNIRLSATDKAGNRGVSQAAIKIVRRPGTPLSIALSPMRATIAVDSNLLFAATGHDVDSNFLKNSDVFWSVSGNIGSIDSTGRFAATRSGIGYISASYAGVAARTDSIEVFIKTALDSGNNRLSSSLSLNLPFNPGPAVLQLRENDSLSDYALFGGFQKVSPVYDFTGSTPMGFAGSFTVSVALDSLAFGSPVADTSLIRVFRYDSTLHAWKVVYGTVPDSHHLLRFTTDSLYTFVVGVDTQPPVVNNLSDTALILGVGGTYVIRGSAQDNIANKNVMVFYRIGGQSGYDSLAVTDSANGNFALQLFLSGNGLEYFVRAADGTYTRSTGSSDVRVKVANLSQTQAFPSQQWKLFSMPVALGNDSLHRNLKAFGDYKYDWRLYGWGNGQYVEKGADSSSKLTTGASYWLKTVKQGIRLKADTGFTVPVNQCFAITLNPGVWTLIGDPFNYGVSWARILDSTGSDSLLAGPYTYADSNWVPPMPGTVIQPWEGYYVKNRGTAPIQLKIPSIAASGAVGKALVLKSDSLGVSLEWEVRGQGSRVFRHYFGVAAGKSTSGYDYRYDNLQPPTPLDSTVQTWFVREGYGRGMDKLLTDFSAFNNGGETWRTEVSNITADGSYSVFINGAKALPDALKAYVVDRNRKVRVDMKASGQFSFVAGKGELSRKLEVLVGDANYIARNIGDIRDVPVQYSLSNNYPNPFNPVTSINYAVPEIGKGRLVVDLRVYDIRGKQVKALVLGRQESGYYRVQWDGKIDAAKLVASGVYFYRINIGNKFQKTIKMVMVK